jgi:hypothetical protein
MSAQNIKFLVIYVLLVGVPVAALIGVLKHGKTLTAPKSVDGNWQFQSGLSEMSSLPCGTPANADDAVLNISQSGKNFELTLPNGFHTETFGTIDGMTLKATLSPAVQPKVAGCQSDKSVTLIASLNTDVRPRTLSGTMALNGCPTCSQIAFLVTPQRAPVKKGAH